MTSATKPEVRFFYLRNEERTPVACVASVADSDTVHRYAVSTWNPLDHYNRELARALAFYRLHTQPSHVSGLTPETNIHEVIVCAIADDSHMPTRTRSAAELHLIGLINAKVAEITKDQLDKVADTKPNEDSKVDNRFSNSSIHYMVPSGDQYGFPKPYHPFEHEHIVGTLIRDGYPAQLAKANYKFVKYLTREQATTLLMRGVNTPPSSETTTQPSSANK